MLCVEDGTNGNAVVEDAPEGYVHSDGYSVILDECDPELILKLIIKLFLLHCLYEAYVYHNSKHRYVAKLCLS